ncbi:twitching motility protein PilU [Fluviicoccus keumensis]|uniref:Twitching motility protein PilU n=1 Tax=Fluviicoccus keumensis TaxID=1435465 RepID=A0A4Q7ZC64_9GAMM|nr:PilT/PilU family type 4a pilus ATPase [Fluviicoccus keumensis]RZU47721.1 twitching motility protein PilU [Fluviicoccus keumensis]
MDFDDLLKLMVEKGGSDMFISAGIPPSIKLNGKMVPITKNPLTPDVAREVVLSIMSEDQRLEFQRTKECNFAISARGIGRFRVSAYYQRNMASMVLRRIETNIPKVDDLKLPEIIKELAMTKRGIIMFVGATGTGKSTSLAAMIGHRNTNSRGHIITIEDPIEFLHQHQGCVVSQREVGLDTESFEVALKNTLRQAPDVILIGEIRTREVMDFAIAFAETGHLVLATLHANNANQALDRIIHFFPADRHEQLFMDLSLNLRGIVAQQLVPTPDGKARRACIEVLLNTPLASDYIRKGEVHNLKELMKKSRELGMQTFDQALFDLYTAGEITYEDALKHADAPNDLRLMIKLGNTNDSRYLDQATRGLSLQNSDN